MRTKLLEIWNTHTVRQSVITTISTFASAGLGAVYYLILARVLGSVNYGLFSLAVSILMVGVSVTDLGIGQGMVKFVGANREDRKYFPYAKLSWQTKLITGSLAIIFFTVLAKFIAIRLFHQPALATLLPLVGWGILFQLLLGLSTVIFQGLQNFWLWGGIQVGTNLLRLIIFGLLLLAGGVGPVWAMASFCLSYLIGFVISLKWLDTGWLASEIPASIYKNFWQFNRWTALFTILISLTSRLDIMISGRFLTLAEVGVYSLAVSMGAFLPQLAGAIGAVTTAKFAGLKDTVHERLYLKKATLFVLGISLLIAVLMIPVAFIMMHLAGSDYYSAWIPFLILQASLIIFISTNPIRDSILYFHGRPRFFVWLTVGQATVILLAGFYLVPHYRIVGAALTVLISQVYTAAISLFYYFSFLKR